MSIVQYANKTYNIIHDILDDESYFNYSYCQNIETKEYVVVEKIHKERLKNALNKLPIIDVNKTYEDYLNAYKNDLFLLKEISCENILQGIDFIDENEQIIVVKEYADMNLRDYIKKEKKHGINPKEIRFIFNQINKGLEIFKNKKNIHTCLSNENVFIKFKDYGLVTNDYKVKIADFGSLSKLEIHSKFQLNIKQKIPFIALNYLLLMKLVWKLMIKLIFGVLGFCCIF
jgi:serine/threonine protein kinase